MLINCSKLDFGIDQFGLILIPGQNLIAFKIGKFSLIKFDHCLHSENLDWPFIANCLTGLSNWQTASRPKPASNKHVIRWIKLLRQIREKAAHLMSSFFGWFSKFFSLSRSFRQSVENNQQILHVSIWPRIRWIQPLWPSAGQFAEVTLSDRVGAYEVGITVRICFDRLFYRLQCRLCNTDSVLQIRFVFLSKQEKLVWPSFLNLIISVWLFILITFSTGSKLTFFSHLSGLLVIWFWEIIFDYYSVKWWWTDGRSPPNRPSSCCGPSSVECGKFWPFRSRLLRSSVKHFGCLQSRPTFVRSTY